MIGNRPAIEVSRLEKRFGSFRAVKGISLSVAPGEIFGFLGANGAGKSTTIKMLCGLLPPSGGTAFVAGVEVTKDPEEVKRRIGYMSQKFSLYRDLTVDENLSFFGGIYGMSESRLRVRREDLLTLLALGERRHDLAGALPRGFEQRLALAVALLHEPSVVFLDEPTAGVDPLQRRAFWEIMNDLAAHGTTLFVTTHFLDEAEFCHRIAIIADGEIVACDSPTRLKGSLAEWMLVEVTADNAAALLPQVRSLPNVRSAALFGDALHLLLPRGADPAAVLSSVAGIRGIEEIEPTLEDLFLWYAEKRA